MENQNKQNKELLYSFIFFMTAVMWFFFNPLAEIRNLIELSPNAVEIKYKLFNLGIFPIFFHVSEVMMAGSLLFLFCGLYLAIKATGRFSKRA